jgi:putative membrane protein
MPCQSVEGGKTAASPAPNMAVAESLRTRARANPRAVTAVLSVAGYALVAGAFSGAAPFPDVSRGTVILLGDAIAVVNTLALVVILAGVRFIRRGEVRKHRAAMLSAFALIMLFLVMYLLKVGGGFEKAILAEGAVRAAYLAMLAVHVLLSALAVPVVLHAVVLGLTHTPPELRETVHARVGRIAVAAWSLSLFLGVVTYLLLNHVYGWEPRGEEGLLLLAAGPPVRSVVDRLRSATDRPE